MNAAHRENDFAARLDLLVDSHTGSIALTAFWAAAYPALNRETKYFDALVRLFDLYIAAGDVQHASETFDMLVNIDPYDARNQKRFSQIEAHADPAFLSHIRSRLGQPATHSPEAAQTATQGAPPSTSEEQEPLNLEDLIVQAEIFLQYSLQSKAVER